MATTCGAHWFHSVRITGSTGSARDDTLRVEVVDYELVTVPAGSFMAFRMIASLGGTKFQEYWYAPEVRNAVKSITRTGIFTNVTTELLDYQKTNAPVINLSGPY